MFYLYVFELLGDYSIACGEYTTACISAGPICRKHDCNKILQVDVEYSYAISVNSKDEATKVIQTEKHYADSACKKDHYLMFETEYFCCMNVNK